VKQFRKRKENKGFFGARRKMFHVKHSCDRYPNRRFRALRAEVFSAKLDGGRRRGKEKPQRFWGEGVSGGVLSRLSVAP